jgi:uncharacterized protein with ParB-like and HNH nuclease domain
MRSVRLDEEPDVTMSTVQEIRIHLEGVSTALKTRRFRVPAYQRSYAWESEHVEALLADIQDAIKAKEAEYFLGSIVITGHSSGRQDVVDGQQRLTTVSLLIAAIKDVFLANNDHDAATPIKTDYLASTDRRTKEKEPKLVLNEVDNELFQELIDDPTKINRQKYVRQSHGRLFNAWDVIDAFLKAMLKTSKDPEEDLHTWLDYLDANLKIIVVAAPDDSNAFVIFETLNDRGLDLAISDLLKNYLFHKSGDKLDETKNRWLSMVAILEGATDDPLIVTFLRHVSMAKYGLIREKELFQVVKRKVTSKKHALDFSSELQESAKVYSALLSTDHDFWTRYDPTVANCVAALNLLGMIQIRPLLLATLQNFDKPKVRKVFSKLVAVAVRFQIVGGVGGGTLERIYAETAKGVTEKKLTTDAEIIKAFTSLPTDSAFEQAFAVATISKQSLARFYLRCLEMRANASSNEETVPSDDPERLNLEHVLPLTLSEAWLKTWDLDDARAYQKRIGNLTLLQAKANSKSGNDSFESKRSVYDKSTISITKSIAKEKKWDYAAVDRRQLELAKLAVKIWSVK